MTQHHDPPPSVIVQRYRFHTRFRQTGESVAMFMSKLRSLAQTCNFGSSLEDMLRDRLLSESKLSFTKALELAQGFEAAAKNLREIQSGAQRGMATSQAGEPVNKVSHGVCFRCGWDSHMQAECPFRGAKCHSCGKTGHIKRTCRSKKTGGAGGSESGAKRSVKRVQRDNPPDPDRDSPLEYTPVKRVQRNNPPDQDNLPYSPDSPSEYTLYQVVARSPVKPLEVDVEINGQKLSMEVDTGAAVSLISETTFQKWWPGTPLEPSSARLQTYSGEPIAVVGQLEAEVKYGEQQAKVPLLVVEGGGPSLFGRDWLAWIKLNWKEIHRIQGDTLERILDRHRPVFQEGLGTLIGYKAKIYVDPAAKPRFCRARPVPYALREKVEEELNRLVKEGIVEPVQFADWAAPIVPVPKGDGSLRMCGDFKVTVNQVSKLDRYPLPRIEDLFAQLSGGKLFSKLDLSQAYQQVVLEEESKAFVVINTHRGLFRYNRLPFGISSAPGIFQRVMESVLQGLARVVVFIDDILVTGRNEQEHLASLGEVLHRLEEAGLRLRKSKCRFMLPSVTYLGYQIDAQGLHPVAEKVEAIREAPVPQNVSELKSYLGLLSYYSRFLPNMSSSLAPLYHLLRKGACWGWTDKEMDAFRLSKQLLLSSQVHFDPEMEIVVACDASAYGIGAVLSHRLPDGTEKPVGFVSRTLTDTERKYSQLEKEGLACVFAVSRFHSYVYGHHFTLITDHKPLLT